MKNWITGKVCFPEVKFGIQLTQCPTPYISSTVTLEHCGVNVKNEIGYHFTLTNYISWGFFFFLS